MPSVIDAHEVVEHDRHDLYEEQPRVYGTRAGFWPTVAQYMRRQRVRRLQSMSSLSHIWTHSGLQGQFHVIARRNHDCTHIYGLLCGKHAGLPALMDSALFLLNTFTTC